MLGVAKAPSPQSKKPRAVFSAKSTGAQKKVQLIAVIATFTIVGGGYMAYRSYAATSVNSVSSASLTKNRARTFSIKEQKESTGKRNSMVALIQPTGSISWSPGAQTLTSVNYRVCTTARHEGRNANARIWVGRYGTFSKLSDVTRGVNRSDEYTKICSDSFRGTGGRVSVTLSNPASTNFRSGIIVLERH